MSTLFEGCTAVLMDGADTVLESAFVAVEGASIVSVGIDRPQGPFDRVVKAAGKVLMPGLVNAHTHLPMTLMRGYGGGHSLHDWLHRFIFPAEDKLDSRSVRAGTALALCEMVAGGVTAFADMYFFCDDIIAETAAAGLSANISRSCSLFPGQEFFPTTHQGFREMGELVERWHGANDGQITVDVSIHAEYTSDPRLWLPMAEFAAGHNLGMQIHISETRAEHAGCLAKYGLTPTALMERYGVWNTRALAAHCVYTTPEDWAILARHGVTCVHNPVSNLKLASGVAPVLAMAKAGVNVALGTDGVSSNNSHDLFAELKLAAILHSGLAGDPLALSPGQALRMATVNGAHALGRKTGTISPGASADLILLDFDRPGLIPCHNVYDNLVYSARSGDVVMNMARGNIIYENGTFFTLDIDRIRHEMRTYAVPKIFG